MKGKMLPKDTKKISNDERRSWFERVHTEAEFLDLLGIEFSSLLFTVTSTNGSPPRRAKVVETGL
jgi:hypothetical protein